MKYDASDLIATRCVNT